MSLNAWCAIISTVSRRAARRAAPAAPGGAGACLYASAVPNSIFGHFIAQISRAAPSRKAILPTPLEG
eukprot:COSAG03_NODE_11111_length_610_cov_38.095890_1_plen_67_part_10